MKKVVAAVLVVAICICNAVVVKADSVVIDDLAQKNSQNLDVTATYEGPSTPTYSVTMTWGTLKFRYSDTGMTWNTTEYGYETTASGEWTSAKADGSAGTDGPTGDNAVTITNASDRHISVEVSFNPASEVLQWGQGGGEELAGNYYALSDDGTYIPAMNGNVCTALEPDRYINSKDRSISSGYIEITGGRPKYLKDIKSRSLGTVTITIGAYNPSYSPHFSTEYQ